MSRTPISGTATARFLQLTFAAYAGSTIHICNAVAPAVCTTNCDNSKRSYYIRGQEAEAVLAACPAAEWRRVELLDPAAIEASSEFRVPAWKSVI